MKSYSLELVQRKTGSGTFGKFAAALLGAGVYLGYKKLLKKKKGNASSTAQKESSYDVEAHEDDDFTARIFLAAKKTAGK